jgi:amino acid transporter
MIKNDGHKLNATLGLKDLTAMGIAAIIGAGIFGTIGNAAATGGPAVIFLFIFTAIACAFSALCYAEFASALPLSGSAYTYAKVAFGEVVAWIIGWDLLMEYSIGNIAVAISWSDYFTSVLNSIGISFPAYFSTDYLSASRGYNVYMIQTQNGILAQNIPQPLQYAYQAWKNAPQIGTFKIIADLPALGITILITWIVYVGINQSKKASNWMVIFKIVVILCIIVIGAQYINFENWTPFAPNGFNGVMKGVSAVFFAYIGFDAISTTAEECKNPQKDLPKAMLYSLTICTLLYVMIALLLTGMVPFGDLAVGDPLSFVFEQKGFKTIAAIIGISALIAMTSVLLVFQLGQPRIWMSMSRDGLLPKKFSSIHPQYKTPWFSTIVTGLVVGIPALFMNLTEVTDLTSIGTLFAFAIVCAGVLWKPNNSILHQAKFKVPYLNSRHYLPIILIAFFSIIFFSKTAINSSLIIFLSISVLLSIGGLILQWSLIPLLGLLTNIYLMTALNSSNWLRFGIWLMVGLIIYWGYKKWKIRFDKSALVKSNFPKNTNML